MQNDSWVRTFLTVLWLIHNALHQGSTSKFGLGPTFLNSSAGQILLGRQLLTTDVSNSYMKTHIWANVLPICVLDMLAKTYKVVRGYMMGGAHSFWPCCNCAQWATMSCNEWLLYRMQALSPFSGYKERGIHQESMSSRDWSSNFLRDLASSLTYGLKKREICRKTV